MPKISVVVVISTARGFWMTAFSPGRPETYRDYEVIVVDNASQDGSVEHIRSAISLGQDSREQGRPRLYGGMTPGFHEASGGPYVAG